MSVFVQPIYTQTVGAGGAATIAFNNIPQGFTDLKLVMSVRGSNALANAYGIIGMNGAVSNSGTYMVFNGSVSSGAFTSFFYYTPSEQTANTFGVTEVYIPNYTGGNYKQLIIDSASEANSTAGYMNLQSVSTSFTGPITSLTLSGNGGTFLQHSTFTLYGVSSHFDVAAPLAPTIGAVTDQAGFASVAFTPAANDGADSYVVTSNPSGSTTYGALSPIITPATLDTSYTYQVSSVNSKGTSASAASSAVTSANAYSSIATLNGTGSASTIIFTNIPQNYTHLQIRGVSRSGSSSNPTDNILITYNNQTGNVYATHGIEGDGANARFVVAAATNGCYPFMPGASSTAFTVGAYIIDILEYTNPNKNKTIRSVGGWTDPATATGGQNYGVIGNNSGMQGVLAPVTQIQIGAYVNFSTLTSFALYGIA